MMFALFCCVLILCLAISIRGNGACRPDLDLCLAGLYFFLFLGVPFFGVIVLCAVIYGGRY